MGALRCKELGRDAQVLKKIRCKKYVGRSSRRSSTVGEQINQINGNDVLALFTALYGPQHCSFTNRTEQTKSWPLFGASFAAIRRRKDREMMKLLQIWASTIGLGPNVKLQPCHKATRVLPKLLYSTIVAPLDTFDSPAKYDMPCNMQPLQQWIITASTAAAGTIAQAPNGS